MINHIKASALALGTSGMALIIAGITNSGGVMTVETADVTLVNTANSNFLSSAFEILKFVPTIAMIAGGFYVLNKIFGLIPKSGGSK